MSLVSLGGLEISTAVRSIVIGIWCSQLPHAYNTDEYAATKFLDEYDNRKKLYIFGNGGYSKAVQYSAKQCRFDFRVITRDDWDELKGIRKSVVYNCTPVEIEEKIHQSNDYINCLTYSDIGIKLANLQASKQYKLYTGLEFPL